MRREASAYDCAYCQELKDDRENERYLATESNGRQYVCCDICLLVILGSLDEDGVPIGYDVISVDGKLLRNWLE